MPRVYVVKAVDDSGQPIPGIFAELQAGRARIGWSYQDDLDLRLIQNNIQQGQPLNQAQQKAKRCLGFLTRVVPNDYLLYPHQPNRGEFCVVQVMGDYNYLTAANSLNGDFRSVRPCTLLTPNPIDMYDQIVPAQLRYRLGLQGRFYGLSDSGPFFTFLNALPQAGHIQDDSNQASLQRIYNDLRERLPNALLREFSRADLSRRFCPDLFERMGYSFVVQEGPAEAGSDIVVILGSPLLPDSVEIRIGVQVFAAKGTVEESFLQSKLEQLLQGWEHNSLDYGVLLTTGLCSEEAKEALYRHNENNPDRLVRLIGGNDLADLFLQYF